MKNLRCTFRGHVWEYGLPSGHSWCNRCERYDDHPAIVRAESTSRFLRKWSPAWITFRRRDLTVRVGYHRPFELSANARIHFGWDRTSELPGLTAWVNLWRLLLGAGIGSGWQDEDGETRGLLYVTANFQTYGLRYIGCWFGHKPKESVNLAGHVYCDRCDESIELADVDPRKAAAA